jgi:hypothetical protein
VRDALAVYYLPGMWDWQRSVVLPLVLQGLARSMGGPAGGGGDLAAGEALLGRYFEWAPRFEVNLPDPAGGDRELVLPDGRPIRYQGRVDLLAGDEHDRYWVVAHRLVDRFATADELLLDEELVAACWALERFYPGMRIAGTIHNELRRANLPVGPGSPRPGRAGGRRGQAGRRGPRHGRPGAAPVPRPRPRALRRLPVRGPLPGHRARRRPGGRARGRLPRPRPGPVEPGRLGAATWGTGRGAAPGPASRTRASMADSGRLPRRRSRSTFTASRPRTTKPIADTTDIYALSLPTIAQVSPAPGSGASSRYGRP